MTLTLWSIAAVTRLELLTICYCTLRDLCHYPITVNMVFYWKKRCMHMIYAQLSRDLENPINVRIPLGESWFSGKSATSCEQLSFKTCSEINLTRSTESELP